MTIQMHKKVKITVLRTEYYQELAEQYAISNLGKCPFHQKGQVLYSDGINPPDGMCGVAWQVIAPMARQLSLGELVQPSGTWLNDDTIGVFACPDGIRPVIHDNRMLAERAFYCFSLGGGVRNAVGRWKDSMPLGEPG